MVLKQILYIQEDPLERADTRADEDSFSKPCKVVINKFAGTDPDALGNVITKLFLTIIDGNVSKDSENVPHQGIEDVKNAAERIPCKKRKAPEPDDTESNSDKMNLALEVRQR